MHGQVSGCRRRRSARFCSKRVRNQDVLHLPMFIFSLSHLRRYRLAMQLKKNIIVVKHEDFVFPEMSLLPDDMKPIVK